MEFFWSRSRQMDGSGVTDRTAKKCYLALGMLNFFTAAFQML